MMWASRASPSSRKARRSAARAVPCRRPMAEVVAGGPHVGNAASGHTAPSSLRTLGERSELLLDLGPLGAQHAVEHRVAAAAAGHRVVAAQGALLDRADVAQPAPGPLVELVGLELDPLGLHALERVLHEQELRPAVDARAPEVAAEPGPADLEPAVGLGQVAEAHAPRGTPARLVGDVVDRAAPLRLVEQARVEERVELGVRGDQVTKYRQMSGSMAMARSDSRSSAVTGRSRTCSFSSVAAATLRPRHRATSESACGPSARGHVAQRAHPGDVLLGEVAQRDLRVLAERREEQHLVQRGQPVPVGQVHVEVDGVRLRCPTPAPGSDGRGRRVPGRHACIPLPLCSISDR